MTDLPPQPAPNRVEGGLGSLLSDLVRDLTGLFRSETRLVRAEIAEALRGMVRGIVMIAVGAVLLLVALIVLAQAAVIALAPATGPGWASLIIGGALVVIAAVLVFTGRSALSASNLVPEKSIGQASRDVQMAKEQLS